MNNVFDRRVLRAFSITWFWKEKYCGAGGVIFLCHSKWHMERFFKMLVDTFGVRQHVYAICLMKKGSTRVIISGEIICGMLTTSFLLVKARCDRLLLFEDGLSGVATCRFSFVSVFADCCGC